MGLVRNRNSTRCSSWLSLSTHVVLLGLISSARCQELAADEKPISILSARISGHVHPSICQTKNGTLVVIYQGKNVLMCTRSKDNGTTWSKPESIPTTAKRPAEIRKVAKFEIYPGTADTLPTDRILVTWNYIADDKANDGYYERALLYTISSDEGKTWSEQKLIGPVDGKHLGAVRHNVLHWDTGRWVLPLRVGPPRVYNARQHFTRVFRLVDPEGKQHEFQQIMRTAKGTMLAMGPVLLHSKGASKTWRVVDGFPAIPDTRDNAEGRYLTALADGRVLVTWGIGHDNKGLRFNLATDDGQTWDAKRTVILLPETDIAARYYSARTIQLDERSVGTVFMNRNGIHFLRVPLSVLDNPK